MPMDGVELAQDGKNSGLLWINFNNIQSHGAKRGTPEYIAVMRKKAAMIDRFLATEFRLGTKHYSREGNLLKTPAAVLHSYRMFGGFFVDLPADRRWKLEGLMKTEGIINHGDVDGPRNEN